MRASRRIVTRSILSSGSRVARYAGRTSRTGVVARTIGNGSRNLWTQAIKGNKRRHYAVFTGILIGTGVAASSVLSSDSAPTANWDQIKKEILAVINNEKWDDGSYGPVLIRLAWHASGTYDKNLKNGGSNGATMRFKPESGHGANAGLANARDLLEPIKKRHPEISYADLWTFAGVVAIEAMGGPKINWRPGRSDAPESPNPCPPDGRLPDAAKGRDHIRDIFYRMGFNDREIVALLGAHTLGRCHTKASGYDGPWTTSPTTFSNEFFVQLLEAKWTERKWNGPKQFADESGTLMMLPADLALLSDPEFRKYVELYANDQKVFFEDFAKAFGKLLELGVPFKDAPAPAKGEQKSWWQKIFG